MAAGFAVKISPMFQKRKRGFVWLVAAATMALVTLPYFYAGLAGGEDYQFRGFLLNPIDGHTYLAKMQQGYRGEWLFTLPYTAEQSEGALLYPLYLGLGHLARLAGLGLPLVYHLARLAAAGGLLWALYRFWQAALPAGRQAEAAFALSALGSGLGWLASLGGAFTADMWVAEAYPFLSTFSSPHFSLSLALLLILFTPTERASGHFWPAALLGLLLAFASPFGVAVASLVLAGLALWDAWAASAAGLRLRRLWGGWPARRAAGVALGGGGVLLYDLWAMQADPVLAGWNAQNLTPAPPEWDMLVSLSPALVFALVGVYRIFRRPQQPAAILVVWFILGLALTYFPWALQRRVMMGLYVPVAGLAVVGVYALFGQPRPRRLLLAALIGGSFLSNALILFAGVHGVQTRDPALYMRWDEAAGLAWTAQNTAPDVLILAGPETGLLIPAFSGRRVVYGHPFETVQAEQRLAQVSGFFGGQNPGLAAQVGADLIWWGPREQALPNARNPAPPGWTPVFATGEVTLYGAP